ncbi:MAG: aminotransferase class V-fold PLP-dependent enzyme [Pseudomonadota bacterium]
MTAEHLPKSRQEAIDRDRADPLSGRRDDFLGLDGTIYLVGHSLGVVSRQALDRLSQAANGDWAGDRVGAWNSAGWIDLNHRVGDRIAALIGAKAGEVLVADSVSINLFKLAAATLPLAHARRLMVETTEFPTDQYIAGGLSDLADVPVDRLEADAAFDALATGGVLIKSAVSYRTGEIADIAAFERKAASTGARIVWDLSHATGLVPLELREDGARFATGCTYKYLNGGPGAPAFLYVRDDVVDQLVTPLPGWLGHARPFAFEHDYTPADGIVRFAAGTPPILSLASLDGALDVFDGLDVSHLLEKSRSLGDLCLARAASLSLTADVPRDRAKRGGHVSLCHVEGYGIVRALKARGIETDFRAPDTVRMGFSPLFLRYVDVWDAMDALSDVLETKAYELPEFQTRETVT